MDGNGALETFAERVPHVVWIARADGYTTYVNGRGVDYLGLTSNHDLGWGWLDRIHPDDRPKARERWDQACVSGEPTASEYRIRLRDGSYRWNAARAAPVKSADGAVQLWVGTYSDIDDHRRALIDRERELDESRADFARAQAIAHIGSVEIDLVGGNDRWSDEVYRIIGREPQSFPPRFEFFESHVHPDDRAAMRETRKATENGTLVAPGEFRVVRPDGQTRWLFRQSDVVRDETGRATKIFVTLIDVTERHETTDALRRNEAELRRSRRHLEYAQLIGRVASAEVDLRTGAVNWSDFAYSMFGLPRLAQAPDIDTIAAVIHPEDRDKVRKLTSGVRSGELGEPEDFRIVDANGAVRWVHRLALIANDESGEPASIIVTMQDITERKLVELELRQRERDLRASREHLARAQRVGNVGSAEVNIDTDEHIWSEGLYRLLGIEAGALKPGFDNFLTFVHPDDRPLVMDIQSSTRRGVAFPEVEFRIQRPNGEIRWLRRMAETVADAEGRPHQIVISFQDFTDVKTALSDLAKREAELLNSREHLSRAQRVGHVGSAEIDFGSGRITWSDELYRLFGLDPAVTAPSFEAFLSVLPPEMHGPAREFWGQGMSGHAAAPRELKIAPPSGEARWLLRQVEMLRGPDGKATGMVTSFQDVTARRKMEEDLRSSREHLALAQRVGHIGSAEFDLITQQVHWSEGLYALLGLDPAKVEPDSELFMSLIHPDDRTWVRHRRDETRAGGSAEPMEFRIVRPDGSLRWIYHVVEVVRDANGRPVKLIGTDLDITDRKQDEIILREREAQLRESQEHLARAQRVGKIGSIEFDVGLSRSRWSDEVYELLGLDQHAAPPGIDTLLAVVHPDDRAAMVARRNRLDGGLSNSTGEFRIIRPGTGEMRWIQVQSGPVATDDDGRPTRALAILQDVTELKNAQQERTEIERRLMQAQKMEAVGNLTGGIAHDFNNLLTVVLGRLDLVEGELADHPQLQEWVGIAMGAARRGAALTRSMLAFSRQQPLQPTAIDIAASLHDMVGLLQRTLGEAIEIKVVYPPDLWICEADAAQLQTALLNLALNARDAMPQGGKLTIDARNLRMDDEDAARNAEIVPGDYVALSVTDTGTGMPPDVVEHAFEPFFTTKEVGKGSGLGLSMVYGYVKQSGGHIKIYSEIGTGTTVSMYLPRSKMATSAKEEPRANGRAKPKGGTEELLVVEDDADMRELTVTVLEKLGYTVHSARLAVEALPLIERHPGIALLLTDISLPGGMNGRQLAERAAAIKPALKVLYMSGYSEDAVIHQGRLDPGIRLLQKPFHNEELAEQIRAALADA